MIKDLKRFHATFFEESFEGADAMEQALVAIDPASVDPETINVIFRAAHSIKGGAATFGFQAVTDFSHHLESLLDAARNHQLPLDNATIDLLLDAVDTVRSLLTTARDGEASDATAVAQVQTRLQDALEAAGQHDNAPADATPAPGAEAPEQPTGYHIRFAPHADLFHSGNEPLQILRALEALGPLEVHVDPGELPSLEALDPEASYLRWSMTLRASCAPAAVQELFAWVEEQCELEILPFSEPAEIPTTAVNPPAARENVASGSPPQHPPHVADHASIRVHTEKLDALMNLAGELVITQAMLSQLGTTLDPVRDEKLLAGLAQLDQQTRQLQEAVMATRMLPVANVFGRFPRLVRDLCEQLGKRAELVTRGIDTELDRGVIEKIADPLTHLIRNALDHGLETLEQRRVAAKPETGTIQLSAEHRGGHILITVSDDGHGLDRERILATARERGLSVTETMSDAEVWGLIFEPGFSTSNTITELSGRGVGLDVVRRNVQDLGGHIDVESRVGQGTRFVIQLPLTLAILDGMLLRVADEVFIVPLNAIVESLQPQAVQVHSIVNRGRVVHLRDVHVPVLSLADLFNIRHEGANPDKDVLVVVEAGERKLALQVDELLGQQQVVVKSLETNYRRVRFISGATILGDGRVSLILDIADLVRSVTQRAAA